MFFTLIETNYYQMRLCPRRIATAANYNMLVGLDSAD